MAKLYLVYRESGQYEEFERDLFGAFPDKEFAQAYINEIVEVITTITPYINQINNAPNGGRVVSALPSGRVVMSNNHEYEDEYMPIVIEIASGVGKLNEMFKKHAALSVQQRLLPLDLTDVLYSIDWGEMNFVIDEIEVAVPNMMENKKKLRESQIRIKING